MTVPAHDVRPVAGAVTEQVDVVVVGAGIAGLVAASLLQAAGLATVCLEARDRVGGRLLSVPGVAGGALDLGASWFWPGERRVARLVGELGLAVHEQHLAGAAVYDDPSGVQRLDGNPVDVPAFRWTGGAQGLASAVAATLAEGTVRLSCPVAAVTQQAAGLLVTTSAGDRLTADQVVLAVPPALAAGTIELGLPADLLGLAQQTPVWMGAFTKVVVEYAEPFWRAAGLAGSAVSHIGPMRELHDLSGPAGAPAAVFGFVPGAHGAATVTRQDLLAQLVRLLGPQAAAPLQVLVADWRTQERTSPQGVELLTAQHLMGHPAYAEPTLAGRLHWATTETSAVSTGHVEGALAGAERAAAAVLGAAGS
ncbi:MAG: FAD-dependent oxidoreductase [Frankiales bacterium]|nr:FAD-dependent oxidoreductase [Frankiales bacterium]